LQRTYSSDERDNCDCSLYWISQFTHVKILM
jgi:hypothetical protein